MRNGCQARNGCKLTFDWAVLCDVCMDVSEWLMFDWAVLCNVYMDVSEWLMFDWAVLCNVCMDGVVLEVSE